MGNGTADQGWTSLARSDAPGGQPYPWGIRAADFLTEVPELRSAIISALRPSAPFECLAPDGEGGSDSLLDLTEPFSIALSPAYERGATSLFPPADLAPASLRSQLIVLEEFLSSTQNTSSLRGVLAKPRSFQSPLAAKVVEFLEAATFAAGQPPPQYVGDSDLLRDQDRVLTRPPWEDDAREAPDSRVDFSSLLAPASATASITNDVSGSSQPTAWWTRTASGSEPPIPPPPGVPRGLSEPRERRHVVYQLEDRPDVSSISPVATEGATEREPPSRIMARRPAYAMAMSAVVVTALALLLVLDGSGPPQAASASAAAPEYEGTACMPATSPEGTSAAGICDAEHAPVASQPWESAAVDPGELLAATVVGASIGSSCGSGEQGPRVALVRVTFEPDGLVTARVEQTDPPLSRAASDCVERAHAGLRVAPFEGAPVALGTTIPLTP